MGQDAWQWVKELETAGWSKWNGNLSVWLAPCGHLFRGPYRAWVEMSGTHLADCIAAGTAFKPTGDV